MTRLSLGATLADGGQMGSPNRETLLGTAPRLKRGVDLRTLRLDAHEGFLVSQIDGTTPAGVLCDLVAMEPGVLIDALRRLEKAGVVAWAGNAKPLAAQEVVERPADELESHPLLGEACDLSRDEKLQILRAERDVDTRSYWHVLKVNAASVDADIKRAYFVASKTYHPDRYFGRDLGVFGGKLERIFKSLKVAYDTLHNAASRQAYAVKFPPPPAASAREPTEPASELERKAETREERRARLENRRQQILEERRNKRREKLLAAKPAAVASKNRKAEELYKHGVMQLRNGQVFAAAASFKLAITYAPDNEQYAALFAEANKRALAERASQVAREAEEQASLARPAKAAVGFERAFELAPHKVEYAIRAAEEFLQAGKTDQAVQHATQAIEASSKRVDAYIVLAEALEQAGNLRQALEAVQQAERLDPRDGRAKRIVKRLTKKRH